MTKTLTPKARVLAFYLPQFHPIPENDEWWGKGFTEWTNVGKAKRYFPGHYQPRVPADLGYYDLRVPETREAQAKLAREYGIEGFVYWHYWFGNGKRLLERPFNEVLASGKPDFPFALAWANESWRGFWHGLSNERRVLIEQTYPGDEDYVNHFNAILPALKDPRYVTCEGKPIFFVYQPSSLPNSAHFIELWQDLARKNGLKGISFIAVEGELYEKERSLKKFRQVIGWGYDFLSVHNFHYVKTPNLLVRAWRKFVHFRINIIPRLRWYDGKNFASPIDSEVRVIPCVYSNWDHTPRTKRGGVVMVGSTPSAFKAVLKKAVDGIMNKDAEHRFITIKSWNEWAEGNYLEPDQRYGHQYLQAIKDVVCTE